MIAQGKNPFLGTAQVKLEGPITLHLQARGVDGKSGTGRVQWRTQEQTEFPATGQTVDFEVPESTTWQDITVQVPVEGRSQLLRLYVPATDGLDIRSIRWKAQDGKPVQWDFSTDAQRKAPERKSGMSATLAAQRQRDPSTEIEYAEIFNTTLPSSAAYCRHLCRQQKKAAPTYSSFWWMTLGMQTWAVRAARRFARLTSTGLQLQAFASPMLMSLLRNAVRREPGS